LYIQLIKIKTKTMHYVLTGGSGHITTPLAEELLKAGHQVTLIGREEGKLKSLIDQGAKTAIGSVEDADFLIRAFDGADMVYLMVPPKWAVSDWIAFQKEVVHNYLQAIEANHIKKVVVLSSVGAHMRQGAGPVDGLAYLETQLDLIDSIDAVYLRPTYFSYNLLAMAGLLKHQGIMGSNFGGKTEKIGLTDTGDIAHIAAKVMLENSFTGKTIAYMVSDERYSDEIAEVLSNAVGKPAPWIVFSDEQAREGMLGAGLPPTIADGYTQLGKALREGQMQEDYFNHIPEKGTAKLEDLIPAFKAAYEAS
jgi:uncharacterized protein YbjT (DUF2867 family)